MAAVLARDAADLDERVASYATWPVLQDEIAALDVESARQGVVQFQVDQGEADVVVLVVGDHQIVAGPGPAASTLLQLTGSVLADQRPARPVRRMPISATVCIRSPSGRSTSAPGPVPG